MKKLRKNLIAGLMVLALMVSMITTPAFAADTITLNPDMSGTGSLNIRGSVSEFLAYDITGPIDDMEFIIDSDRNFLTTEKTYVSDTPAPLNVYVDSVAPAVLTPEEVGDGYVTAPTLVADDAVVDWNNLSRAETKAKIALSLNGVNLSLNNQLIGELESGFEAPSELPLVLTANYGKAWDAACRVKYVATVRFEMK